MIFSLHISRRGQTAARVPPRRAPHFPAVICAGTDSVPSRQMERRCPGLSYCCRRRRARKIRPRSTRKQVRRLRRAAFRAKSEDYFADKRVQRRHESHCCRRKPASKINRQFFCLRRQMGHLPKGGNIALFIFGMSGLNGGTKAIVAPGLSRQISPWLFCP